MFKRLSSFIFATSTLIGTIIGVGMFALPYVALQSGLGLTLLYLIILAVVVSLAHLIYGEIILRTKEKHRFIGYAQIYLGPLGKITATFVFLASMSLALLAYLLIGGEFLKIIFSGLVNFSARSGTLILALAGFYIIFRGIKLTGLLEVLMTIALLLLIVGLSIYGFNLIDKKNLSLQLPDSTQFGKMFLPYGVILFALAGGAAIPEIRSFFSQGRAKLLKSAIILGTLIPALIYGIFIIAVLGISGSQTSAESIQGLASFFGNDFIRYGAVIGFLAVATSFLTIGLNLKNSFILDFKLPRLLGLFLTMAVPLGLFFLGVQNFVKIISVSGGVLGGLEGLLLLAMWSRARKKGDRQAEYSLSLPATVRWLLVAIFLAGILYQFIYL